MISLREGAGVWLVSRDRFRADFLAGVFCGLPDDQMRIFLQRAVGKTFNAVNGNETVDVSPGLLPG
jgi:hypothetical protein